MLIKLLFVCGLVTVAYSWGEGEFELLDLNELYL